MNIGPKYQVPVPLITDHRYRYWPRKPHISQTLIKTLGLNRDATTRTQSRTFMSPGTVHFCRTFFGIEKKHQTNINYTNLKKKTNVSYKMFKWQQQQLQQHHVLK